MNEVLIRSNSDLKIILEKIWISPIGLEATQDLQEGVILEQYYEDAYVATAIKTNVGWEIKEGKAQKIPTMRIFYYSDACDKLSQAKNLEDFSNILQDLLAVRNIVFIPLRSPDKLVEAGFADFAERLGLPAK